MQEVNLKQNYFFHFILLTFLFQAPSLHRKFYLQGLWICALAWWCKKHHLTFTHKSYFLNTSLTTFPFTRDTVTYRERPMFVEFCSSIPTRIIVSSMFSTMRFRKYLRGISLICQG